MPADRQLVEQEEHQLVLLEDEVFDFDDLHQPPLQPPRLDDEAPTAAPSTSASASREAQDTREMIASMLDQQPLMSVNTTPSAYLEYLRIIFNCARLLRQPGMPIDLRHSVTALLAKAKSLYCANALSLIVQTVSAVWTTSAGGDVPDGPPVPDFWGETFSQHECQLWIDLMETLFYFWSDPDPAGLRARRRDDIVVEAFAVGLLDRLADLRAAYAGGPGRPDEASKCGHRAERLAADVRRLLRPRHLLALAAVRKADKALLPVLAAFDCLLEAAGALSDTATNGAKTALGRTKAALDGVTFEQLRAALRLHRPAQFAASLPRMRRLRQRQLDRRPELQRLLACQRPRDLLVGAGPCAKDPGLAEFLAAYAEYVSVASEFELQWQRCVVRDAVAMAPFLLGRLSGMVANNIARARSSPGGCWDSLSEALRADLEKQSVKRLSALTEDRGPGGGGGSRSDASSSAEADQRSGSNGFVTFELDIVASGKSPDFCPEFVLPQKLDVGASASEAAP